MTIGFSFLNCVAQKCACNNFIFNNIAMIIELNKMNLYCKNYSNIIFLVIED